MHWVRSLAPNVTTPLWVGSVKTNIAHLEEAAGVAGFIKTVLALQHGEVPANLHFSIPNPYIEWDDYAVAVPTTLQPWPVTSASQSRIAGVSSFGLSGTNAHLIVASAPDEDQVNHRFVPEGSLPQVIENAAEEQERPWHVLALSAKTPAALPELATRYRTYLEAHLDVNLGDLCYTAAVGRSQFSHRAALVVESSADLAVKLAGIAQGQDEAWLVRGTVAKERPRIAFLFTGQGSQYVGYGTSPV